MKKFSMISAFIFTFGCTAAIIDLRSGCVSLVPQQTVEKDKDVAQTDYSFTHAAGYVFLSNY